MKFSWPVAIVLGAVGSVLVVGALLYTRQAARTNHVALADSAKKVSVITAVPRPFQPTRRYVGTTEPWLEARIGPQLVSAYVDTVLVRPGSVVKRGDVIATLDCRNTSAQNKQVAEEARALDATSTAAAAEASRLAQLLKGKFVSENEVDLKQADAANKQAQVAALRAQLSSTTLQVDDCVLRSPFTAEVSDRFMDPGAFARPGAAIVTVVDRHLIRVTADVPEEDFDAVAPGTTVAVHLLSTEAKLTATISRRSPSAERSTRTAHIEIDIADDAKAIPVWTTAEISLDVGTPIPATTIPIPAATVHGHSASLFLVERDTAHLTVADVVGEHDGVLYLDPKVIQAGVAVINEGRTVLSDNDPVAAASEKWAPQ
jgi:RND family efflux transporter MFP subunit